MDVAFESTSPEMRGQYVGDILDALERFCSSIEGKHAI